MSIRPGLAEEGDNFQPNLEAACADSRTDGGDEIGGLALKGLLHLLNRSCDDSAESATPSGMDSGKGAGAAIGKKDREAVSSLDRQEHPRLLPDEGISGGLFRGDKWRVNPADDRRVDLPDSDKWP